MILTCPSCSARYLLATDAIGGDGRAVRCGKCNHVWQQEPERDSLDDLKSIDFGTSDPAPDDIDFGDASDLSQDEMPSFVQPQSPEPDFRSFLHTPAEPPPSKARHPAHVWVMGHLPQITGGAMGLALFLAIAASLMSARGLIMAAMPASKPLFIALGVEKPTDASKILAFDSVAAKIEKKDLLVTGSLINLSDKLIDLPPLAVELLDAAGAPLASLPASISQASIKGEESIDLKFTYESIPSSAQQVRLVFVSASEEKPTTDEGDADNTHAPEGDAPSPQSAHE